MTNWYIILYCFPATYSAQIYVAWNMRVLAYRDEIVYICAFKSSEKCREQCAEGNLRNDTKELKEV